jgi:hypothetical protein
MDDRTAIEANVQGAAGTAELRETLQKLPLRRDEPPSLLPAGLLLAAVCAVAVALTWRLRRRRAAAGAAGAADPQGARTSHPAAEPASWLSRALGVSDPGGPRVTSTVRLGARGHLHVVRWQGRELLIGTGHAGAPSLIAERPAHGDPT